MQYFFDSAVFCRSEKGNSLFEVLVALSLLSLLMVSNSLLLVSSKTLERKALWQMLAYSRGFSIAEAGHFSQKVDLNEWQAGLQGFFPASTICFQEGFAEGKKQILILMPKKGVDILPLKLPVLFRESVK